MFNVYDSYARSWECILYINFWFIFMDQFLYYRHLNPFYSAFYEKECGNFWRLEIDGLVWNLWVTVHVDSWRISSRNFVWNYILHKKKQKFHSDEMAGNFLAGWKSVNANFHRSPFKISLYSHLEPQKPLQKIISKAMKNIE